MCKIRKNKVILGKNDEFIWIVSKFFLYLHTNYTINNPLLMYGKV